jgi:hypothetical protein
VLGTSGGSIPAVIFALNYICTPYLVVGSQNPAQTNNSEEWLRAIQTLRKLPEKPHGLALVGDEAHQKDFEAAAYLSETIGTLVRVSPGDHNPLDNLARRGELGPLIAETMLLKSR